MEEPISMHGLTFDFDQESFKSKFELVIGYEFGNDRYEEEQYIFSTLDTIESWYVVPAEELIHEHGATLLDHIKCLVAYDKLMARGTLDPDLYSSSSDIVDDWLRHGAPLFPNLTREWHDGFANELLASYGDTKGEVGLVSDWQLYWYDENCTRWRLIKSKLLRSLG